MCNVLGLRQKLPKVNKDLALKLMEEGDDEAELASRKKKGKVGAHRHYKNQRAPFSLLGSQNSSYSLGIFCFS